MKKSKENVVIDLKRARLSPLGKGGFGFVYEMDNDKDLVIKRSPFNDNLLGDKFTSPFRSEQLEPRILEFLWKVIVEPGISPHIVTPLGQKRVLKDSGEVVFAMEKASCGDLRNFLITEKMDNASEFNSCLRVLLFQICFTLEAILMRYPSFRHNDLQDKNILCSRSPPQSSSNIYHIHGRTFSVPDVGVTAYLADFDYACIPGQGFDNYKAVEMELEHPYWCMDTIEDQRVDLFRLICSLRRNFEQLIFDQDMRHGMNRIFGRHPSVGDIHDLRAQDYDCPSIKDFLLESGFFDCFLLSEGSLQASEHDADAPFDSTFFDCTAELGLFTEEVRECMIFQPKFATSTALVSYRYFSSLTPRQGVAGGGGVLDYCQEEVLRIWQLMQDRISLVKQVFLHLGKKQQQRVERVIFKRCKWFIQNFTVPHIWWYLVVTASFTDALRYLDYLTSAQEYWAIEEWVDAWKQQAFINYTYEGMLHFLLQWSWWRGLEVKNIS